jgi:hypothetical protein
MSKVIRLKLCCQCCGKPMGFVDDFRRIENFPPNATYWDEQFWHKDCLEAHLLLEKVEGRKSVLFANDEYGDCIAVK